MNKVLFLIIFSFSVPVCAQITSGTIDYTERRSFEFGDWMDAARRKEMEARMAAGDFDQTGRVSFNTEGFSYQQLPPDPDKENGRNGWMTRMGKNPEIYYVSMADSARVDRRRVMDRAFILKEDWKAPRWNIANRKVGMKELPLPNQLATSITPEGDTLTAYFSESIPLGIGPQGYGGLPGAIVYLKVQKDGFSTEYTMKTMQPNAPDVEITIPDGDKEITRKQFDKHTERAREAMERRRRGWERSGE